MSAEKTESKSPSRSGTKATGKGRPRKPDKPHTWLSDELGAALVAEAETTPGPAMQHLLARYGVSERTLGRWRERVARDAELTAIVTRKRAELAEVWEAGSKRVVRALMRALEHHAELALKLTAFDPDAVHKVAGALKVMNEAMALRAMLPNGKPVRGNREDPAVATPGAVGARAASGGAPAAADAPASTAGTGTRAPVH